MQLAFCVQVEKEFDQKIAARGQLPLKGVDALARNTNGTSQPSSRSIIAAQAQTNGFIHPAGIEKEKFALLRDGGEVPLQERPALFLFRGHADAQHFVKARIQLFDQ